CGWPEYITMFERRHRPLFLIMLLGAALRLVTIDWGLPGSRNPYAVTLMGDEWRNLQRIREYRPLDPELTFSDYTHPITFDIVAFYVKELLAVTRLVDDRDLADPASVGGTALRRYLLSARLLSVTFAMFTIFLTYSTGRQLCDRRTGLYAAAILAITPLHIFETQIAKYNGLGTLLNIVVLSITLTFVRSRRLAPALWLSMALALAISTTYMQGLALLWLPWAALWFTGTRPPLRRRLLRLVSGRMLIVYLGIPVVILFIHHWLLFNPGAWWDDVSNCLTPFNSDDVYYNRFVSMGWPGVKYTLLVVVPQAFGPGLPILLILALVHGLRNRHVIDWILVPILIVTLFSIFKAQFKYTRTFIHSLPFASLLLAHWYTELTAARDSAVLRRWLPRIGILAAVVTLFQVGNELAFRRRTDSRVEAAAWVERHIPAGAVITLLHEPWEFHPPSFLQSADHSVLHACTIETMHHRDYQTMLNRGTGFVITSRLELGGLYGKFADYPDEYPQEHQFMEMLQRGGDFSLVARFRNPRTCCDRLLEPSMLPLDQLLYNVEVLIFARRQPAGTAESGSN
ncbi:glycosyltransferase family 39 protein, partial [bacterium]|nr:glycosyltransferase family 39 protein [candidate division CSSED10-310 bacterium]